MRILPDDLADELRLALRYAVGLRDHLQLVIRGNRLAENGAAEGVGLKQAVDLIGQLLLQSGGPVGVVSVDGDQDRVCGLAQIAVAQHGADQGIHRYLQVTALEIHVPDHNFAVLVQGFDRKHLLLLIGLNFNAGVDIQRDHRIDAVVGLINMGPEQAARKQYRRRSRTGRPPCEFVLSLCLLHNNYLTFLFIAFGKDTVKHIRGSVGKGLFQPFFDFVVFHDLVLLFPCVS